MEEETIKKVATEILLMEKPDAKWTEIRVTQKGNMPVYDVMFINGKNYYNVQIGVL